MPCVLCQMSLFFFFLFFWKKWLSEFEEGLLSMGTTQSSSLFRIYDLLSIVSCELSTIIEIKETLPICMIRLDLKLVEPLIWLKRFFLFVFIWIFENLNIICVVFHRRKIGSLEKSKKLFGTMVGIFQYYLQARGIFHSTLSREYTD